MAFYDEVGRFRDDDPAPPYLQLQQSIRDATGRDIPTHGEAISAGRDLAVECDVSRITVWKAIGGLVGDGLPIERRGFLRDGRAAAFARSCYRGDADDVVAALSVIRLPNRRAS